MRKLLDRCFHMHDSTALTVKQIISPIQNMDGWGDGVGG